MSTPNWWGDWRPILTPHTGNLQPTDLLECTSIVGGLPVNTAITGAQIIAAASGGGASWGGITGTLSAQTDLQTALNGKQATLVSGTNIKTVNSTSLVGSGDVAVQPTLVSGTNIKTVNNNSLLGSGNLTIGPRLMGYSGILGTPTTGNAITICHSLLIPANTLNSNNILQVVFRMYRQSGNVGQMYGRIYFNTTNSLTGATLISGIFSFNAGQFILYCERNYSYDGTSLRATGGNTIEYNPGTTIQTTAFNRTVNQYILFTMQCQNIADVANIDMYKVFAYV